MTHALPDYLTRNVSRRLPARPSVRPQYFNGWEADWLKPSTDTPFPRPWPAPCRSHNRDALARPPPTAYWPRSSVTVFSHPARLRAARHRPGQGTRSRTASPSSNPTACLPGGRQRERVLCAVQPKS